MLLNLQKNDILDLTKKDPSLKNVILAAGWDVAKKGFFGLGKDFDLDLVALLLDESGKLIAKDGMVYFGNKRNNKSDENNYENIVADLKCQQLSRHRGTDIGSQNNGNALGQLHQPRAYKPDRHYRSRAAALQNGGRQSPGKDSENRIFGQ